MCQSDRKEKRDYEDTGSRSVRDRDREKDGVGILSSRIIAHRRSSKSRPEKGIAGMDHPFGK